MSKETFLTTEELAKRWKISARSLDNIRASGKGPSYFKIIGSIRYKLSDVVEYENEKKTNVL